MNLMDLQQINFYKPLKKVSVREHDENDPSDTCFSDTYSDSWEEIRMTESVNDKSGLKIFDIFGFHNLQDVLDKPLS